MTSAGAFDDARGRLGDLLSGPFRQELVGELSRRPDARTALAELASSMRAHRWRAGARRVDLADVVRTLDGRTRRDGFHVLHDWDGTAGALAPDLIAVELATLAADRRGAGAPEAGVLAILFDYYAVYLLALLSLRVWDLPDPDVGVGQVGGVLDILQGSDGSGQAYVRSAATLLLVATSHYEADESAYVRLLERVRQLTPAHQLAIASGHAASMGCHLRFGFEATYGRDIGAMRADNAADYPWLCYALETAAGAYDAAVAAGRPAADLADVILNGLSPDPEAFLDADTTGVPVADNGRSAVRDIVQAHRAGLLDAWSHLRPDDEAYSPLAFFFNFCQNVLKGAVLDAVLWGEPSPVALDDLLTACPAGQADDPRRVSVARTLMRYARSNPHRIRGQLMPVIVYDPHAGRRAHAAVLRALR